MMQNVPASPVNAMTSNLSEGVRAMQNVLKRIWREDDGVLSFEWTVLTSLLTIGVVSGVASVRDAVIDEMGDVAQAMVALDQSYYIQPPLGVQVHSGGFGGWGWGFAGAGFGGMSGASDSGFIDAVSFQDCYRVPPMKVREFPRRSEPAPGAAPTPAEPAPAL
jgi:Flp pilus assembly pilin Flp